MYEKPTYEELEQRVRELKKDNTERKQAETSLMEQYRYLNAILKTTQDGFWVLDEQRQIIDVNDAYCRMSGYTKNELLQLHIHDLDADEKPDETSARLKHIIENGSELFEARHRRKDGSIFDVEIAVTSLDSEIHKLVCFCRDITHQKRTRDSLIESEEKFSVAFKTSFYAIIITNPQDGQFIEVNDAFSAITGYTREESVTNSSIGMDLWVDGEDRNRVVSELIGGKNVIGQEFKFKRKNGEIIIGLFSAQFIQIKGNTYILSSIADITERKQAEKVLEETTYNLRKRIKELNCLYGISKLIEKEHSIGEILQDTADLIPQAWQYHEITSAKIIFQQQEYKTKNFKESEWEQSQEIVISGENILAVKVNYLEKKPEIDEGPFLKEERELINAIAKRLGKRLGHLVEKKRAEEENTRLEALYRQAQKMESIGTLAGGIAHDFNNILSPIVGYTEMILMDTPEDSLSRDSLNQIYTSALRAKDLVKQILTFSRQRSSELILMKMQPIIKEALKLIRSTIPTTIEIIQDINPDCGVIKADPTQIHQIVMNLATNAYHAMEKTGGELKVSLKEVEFGTLDLINPDMVPGVYACLIVADTGVGMDKNLTDKIFDPFFTTKALGKGTGMGLSVVHGIVTAMGGSIHVYSEPEKGTEFHVYLPVEKSLYEKHVTQATIPIRGGTEHILFVDDEEMILQMETLMLERLGYQVTSRTSSLEALEAFRQNPDRFDMVITDMAMPNMPGNKLSAELTKIRPGIPILLCTGFSETMSEEKAASMGIKGFLLKPIIMKDLAQKIREVLD